MFTTCCGATKDGTEAIVVVAPTGSAGFLGPQSQSGHSLRAARGPDLGMRAGRLPRGGKGSGEESDDGRSRYATDAGVITVACARYRRAGFEESTPKAKRDGRPKAFGFEPPLLSSFRRDSQHEFSMPLQTVIIFDWDDTLFPTTYVRDDLGLCLSKPLRDQEIEPAQKKQIAKNLERCSSHVLHLLTHACRCGKVALVTLAKRGWVLNSCRHFYPAVGEMIEQLDVPIIYAQDGQNVDHAKIRAGPSEDADRYWSTLKGKAIGAQVKRFYSQYQGQSWKNVLSIGDSDFERVGTQSAIEEYLRQAGVLEAGDGAASEVNGHVYRVRTKTFKMVDQPTIEELTAQVEMIRRWLEPMVKLDRGFDVKLSDLGDQSLLRRIERTFGLSPEP